MKKFNPNFMPTFRDVTKYIRQSMIGKPERRIAFLKARLRLRSRLDRYYTTREQHGKD